MAKSLISLIALALNLDEDHFEKVGAMPPMGFIRLLHYPGWQIYIIIIFDVLLTLPQYLKEAIISI